MRWPFRRRGSEARPGRPEARTSTDWLQKQREKGFGDDWVTNRAFEHSEFVEGLREQIHARPEPAFQEFETTALVVRTLEGLGRMKVLQGGTGSIWEIGPETGPVIAVRCDLDSLVFEDGPDHACGHDMHTAAGLGAALILAQAAEEGRLNHRVRFIFQPAEEVAGGMIAAMKEGAVDEDVVMLLGIHSWNEDVGNVLLVPDDTSAQRGAIPVELTFRGEGGHSARPHESSNLTQKLFNIGAALPGLMADDVDFRDEVQWTPTAIEGDGPVNVTPSKLRVKGTLRMPFETWEAAKPLFLGKLDALARANGVRVDVDFPNEIPPVMNHRDANARVRAGVENTPVKAKDQGKYASGGDDIAYGQHGFVLGDKPTFHLPQDLAANTPAPPTAGAKDKVKQAVRWKKAPQAAVPQAPASQEGEKFLGVIRTAYANVGVRAEGAEDIALHDPKKMKVARGATTVGMITIAGAAMVPLTEADYTFWEERKAAFRELDAPSGTTEHKKMAKLMTALPPMPRFGAGRKGEERSGEASQPPPGAHRGKDRGKDGSVAVTAEKSLGS